MLTNYYTIHSAKIVKNSVLLAFLLLFTLGISTNSWSQILTFEFASIAGDEATVGSNSNDANLSASTISRGAGLTASANADRFNATNWAETSIANAVTGDNYMEFTITPNSGYEFRVTSIYFQVERSSTGPRGIALRSSEDGYASNLDQEYAVADVTTDQTFTFTFTQNFTSSAVTYRIYMWAEGTSGSGGIGDASGDDIIVYGSTTANAEPTNHISSYTTIVDSHKDISQTWLDNDGSQVATGFLFMINRTGTFNPPVDGTPQTDDTDISDGDGLVNISHGVEAYTWENLDPSTGYYFICYPYNGDGDERNYKTNDTPTESSGTTDAPPDSDSDITDPTTQIAAATISSTIIAAVDAVDVFSFKINDKGSGDGFETKVDTIRVRPYSTNTTDWTDHIQGVVLNDGTSDIIIGTEIITDTYIDIPIAAGDLNIADGGSKEITLSIYLNPTNIEDGEILSFYIDYHAGAHKFSADEYGSTFTSDALSADIVSNDFTVDVVATKLVFNSVPSDININTDFTAEVWATDANGNLDINDASSVTLTSSGGGTLSSSNSQTLTESLSNGIYSWTGLQNDTEETFNLNADDAGSFDLISSSITAYATGVAIPGSIFISEFMADPDGGSGEITDANGEYIELYNSNSFPVDIDGWVISDDGTDTHTISNGSALEIPATGFLVIGLNSTTPDNGDYTTDYVYTGVTLANSVDEIVLTNSGATEISRVNYDTGNGWTITTGSSLIFTGTASDDNSDTTLWITSSLREKGYLGSTLTDNGSPGRNGLGQDFVSTATWTGSGNWSEGNLVGNTNWDNGVPGPSTNVTIDGTVTVDIDSPAACNNLTISSGNTLTVNAGKALTVNGALANNNGSASGLYLDADATSVSSLITNSTISGDATVISYFTDLSKYYLVSPPISNALGSVFTGDVVYYYDEPNYTWQNPTNLDFSFEAGIGYAIYKNTDNTVTYSGTLNTGAISKTLTYANAGHSNPVDGWNLMGNPYPSVLDISYLDYTDISNGVWVNLHNSTSDYYVYWSKTLGTVGSSGEGGGDERARYIQPGQGFWIYTDVDGTAFNLDNSMRTHQNQGVFSKSAEANTDTFDEILKISVSGNDIVDPAYILFRSNASLNFDRDYDLLKMTSSSATVPHIFSLTTEEYPQKLAINAIAKPQSETVVPLGLKIGTDGTYRLYFDGMNSFEDSQDFYLRDRLNGELYDIRQEPVIEFTHSTSNEEHRFDLVMGLQTDINTLGVSIPAEVYSFRNTLYIRPGLNQEIIQVKLRNLLGQIVYSRAFNTSFITGVQLNLPTAFYLVDIQLKSGSYSKKIFIQNLN